MFWTEGGHPLEVREVSGLKGRGVFTVDALSNKTLVSVSPILLFPRQEYEEHGKYTRLDHYVYRWPGGMALSLGLGSLFNHSRQPNVGFIRDTLQGVIRYYTIGDVAEGEELCISYGKRLWFQEDSGSEERGEEESQESAEEFMASIGFPGDGELPC